MKISQMAVMLIAAALSLTVAQLFAASGPPEVGANAPDFRASSQEGTPVSLAEYRGKWVVLYFYPRDMTQGCTIEAHNFQRDLPQYDQKNAVILGVSVDGVDSHKEFCAKESLTFKLLADTSHDITEKYGSLADYKGVTIAARNTFIIDPKGVIRKVYLKVSPNPHSAEVLAALTEMQKGAGE